ncbi:Bcr/CflA family efflux MFS transporter [Microbacterium album]|uniref:Bcr/CflA family drug resistance efflux transporter n=1 Tax=Microbacterium album TaxID=2053191 RepID=A0A917IFG0_9MICO|nr:Bcr/CflA family efflux MFS transporter [Microbacterium album]GGH44877.1 Bcr/CflA family drug resistance efflux transporter [Microbacterium album]
MSADRPRGGPAPAAPSRPELTPGMLVALGFIGMAGSLSTDLYLPAFPSMQAHFGATAASVQLTLTAYLIGAAAGQFVVGTLSDALGRRRTLLAALAVFAAAGYVAAAAPSLEWVIALRLLQGLSGAAGVALARAVIADLAAGEQAARGLSLLMAMTGLGPVFGSPLGALLTAWGGWRAALLGLAVIATAMLLVAMLVIPESLAPEARHPARLGPLVRTLGRLGRDGAFLGYVVAFACTYAALIVYIGASSFVVQRVFDASPVVYSLTFSAGSVAFVAGAWLNGRAVRRLGPERALAAAHVLALGAATALTALALAGTLTLAAWVPLVCLFSAGCAAGMSDASALTLQRAAFAAGSGSASLGLFQYSLGAVASPFGGLWGDHTALPAAAGMTGAIALAMAAAAVGSRLARRSPTA